MIQVVLGGGRSYFTPAAVQDPETGARGRRRDGKNLVDQWLNDHPDGVYITHRDQLLALDPDQASPVFGNNPFSRKKASTKWASLTFLNDDCSDRSLQPEPHGIFCSIGRSGEPNFGGNDALCHLEIAG